VIRGLLLLGWGLIAAGEAGLTPPGQSAAPGTADSVAVIRAFDDGPGGMCAAKPGIRLSITRDASTPDGPVLLVEYPAPTGDPAGRDVQCIAKNRNWTAGRAIRFRVKPEHPMRMSISFVDRNRVAYTAWKDLTGGEWQWVRIPFDEIRPNPFFQPPGAKTGAPIDVSDVTFIAFAPQDQASGRLAIGTFVVSK
jgi:hypothetical protein